MKSIKISLAVAASALLMSAPAMAFHDGGVASCESCHSMHNSFENASMPGGAGLTGSKTAGTVLTGGVYLLQGGGKQSDACLNCHEVQGDGGANGYHISTAAADLNADLTQATAYPKQMGPGGDFAWLKVATGTAAQQSHRGHNIGGTAHGYAFDTLNTTAPGGLYPATELHCSSCHDPHGKFRRDESGTVSTSGAAIAGSGSYSTDTNSVGGKTVGVYRLLAGAGYQPKSASVAFGSYPPPMAVAPATYNRTENDVTKLTRVAYGKGMSEWCSNCHTNLLSNGYVSGNAGAVAGNGHATHPAGNTATMPAAIQANYNGYLGTGVTPGAGKYDSLVPFEEGGAVTYATLRSHATIDGSVTTGPDASSTVMCLSCHRAHASGFQSMTRYDVSGNVTVDDGSYSTFADVAAMKLAAYYQRPASAWVASQRALCNKCHAKD
jgi:hypothetical protein